MTSVWPGGKKIILYLDVQPGEYHIDSDQQGIQNMTFLSNKRMKRSVYKFGQLQGTDKKNNLLCYKNRNIGQTPAFKDEI